VTSLHPGDATPTQARRGSALSVLGSSFADASERSPFGTAGSFRSSASRRPPVGAACPWSSVPSSAGCRSSSRRPDTAGREGAAARRRSAAHPCPCARDSGSRSRWARPTRPFPRPTTTRDGPVELLRQRSTDTLCCVRIQSAVSDASDGSRSAIAAGRRSEGHARGCARIQSPRSPAPSQRRGSWARAVPRRRAGTPTIHPVARAREEREPVGDRLLDH
jgi:hypothetical protein